MIELNNRSQAWKIVLFQALIALAVALAMWGFFGIRAAYSAILGGIICALPNSLFILIFFRHSGAQSAKKIVRSFYFGEALKLVFTAGLFVMAILWFSVAMMPLILTFLMTQLAFWLAPLFIK